ncbi:MAG: exo-alpha-sialidase [Cyclobacteriaceae bacterium]|nr:exo-alpha-sialidase [Cyclobacteriaceae bacterium SS2]
MIHHTLVRLIFFIGFLAISCVLAKAQSDWRNITAGIEIPTRSYADQPYIVKTDDGAWLCILTTGAGREGEPGQVVAVTRSEDQGKTWSDLTYLEPLDGPEASYAVMLKVPSGRIYAFYNHNTDNIRWVRADSAYYKDGKCYRVDSQGYFVFKYSDDHGKAWSENRYTVPVREFEIDRNNAHGGDIRFFWNVGRAFQHNGKGYVPLHKVGGFGQGFFTSNEGVLLMSPNILTEKNPKKIKWETLPDGDIGLRTPPGGGPISAEQNFSVLSDGSFYVVYRSVDGHPVYSYSRDEGHTWEPPKYQAYANGKLMKHPRAANFAWRCRNGKYLYWYHNHGGRSYDDRNPVWISGGVEVDGPDGKIIQWSQPEILLYDRDPYIRMSYPDMVEEEGEYYFTETQKSIARIHRVDRKLLEGLWGQFEKQQQEASGTVLTWTRGNSSGSETVKMPRLPEFVGRDASRADHGTKNLNAGFTVDMKVKFSDWEAGKTILDSRLDNRQGLVVSMTDRGTLELQMHDRRTIAAWDSDPVFEIDKTYHVTITVDGGPGIISFVVDGQLCDGGTYRQFGWGRFSPDFRHANGADQLVIDDDITELNIYDRALTISESIGNYLSK